MHFSTSLDQGYGASLLKHPLSKTIHQVHEVGSNSAT